MSSQQNNEVTYQKALEECKKGKVSSELKELYLAPKRDQVPWILFPNWARPNDPVEGAHEG